MRSRWCSPRRPTPRPTAARASAVVAAGRRRGCGHPRPGGPEPARVVAGRALQGRGPGHRGDAGVRAATRAPPSGGSPPVDRATCSPTRRASRSAVSSGSMSKPARVVPATADRCWTTWASSWASRPRPSAVAGLNPPAPKTTCRPTVKARAPTACADASAPGPVWMRTSPKSSPSWPRIVDRVAGSSAVPPDCTSRSTAAGRREPPVPALGLPASRRPPDALVAVGIPRWRGRVTPLSPRIRPTGRPRRTGTGPVTAQPVTRG